MDIVTLAYVAGAAIVVLAGRETGKRVANLLFERRSRLLQPVTLDFTAVKVKQRRGIS